MPTPPAQMILDGDESSCQTPRMAADSLTILRYAALALLVVPGGCVTANAGEPPVSRNLILHLSASSQPALRQKFSLPPSGPGRPVDYIVDGSGANRHFSQPLDKYRPGILSDGRGAALIRFDGEDDFLSCSGPRTLTPSATVIVLAAARSNAGQFRAFFSAAARGENDFTSGLNLDLGGRGTPQMSFVNVESAGASGEFDMLQPGQWTLAADLPFGGFHVFTLRSAIKPLGNELWIDGVPSGKRDRLESNLALDELVLGARFCSNDGTPPAVRSFGAMDIAEVLVFDRALSDDELRAAESPLLAQAPALNALASGKSGHALQVLKDPPPVQMLVPGFSVSELPVKLTNRNNLRYRHDGKLVALGYDGTIHLLTDTDGDGLEDKAEVLWDKESLRGPLGIELTKKGDPRGEGVFVASKGKISLILDEDRDGKGDKEIIVATGWKEIPQNVDAVGMAIDPKDGSLYFCLGCANYANAYLIDPAIGKAGYDVKSDRGTIQRVSADFKTRETICTGVRFACALAFNDQGDLFSTEQEGATWLPNGNAFDELLHIERGKHYGFPPRHPKHLPDVRDWPAVVEYGPQHQSTVGMVFNEGVNGGPHFGPAFWKGDALVCGEARGKLYRTKLVKTPHGYIGQNNLIACLGLLTVDTCVSPRGDLLIACHTGPPDWGTGPKGDGRIFKARYTGKDLPQPVWAWSNGPDEFRIAFDRELKPEDWRGKVGSAGSSKSTSAIRIEAGRYVSAGDRYEVIRPGYQIVRDQMADPRMDVDVLGVSLTPDNRVLVINVAKQARAVNYAITLPLPPSWQQQNSILQRPEMDVLATMNGVEAKIEGQPSVVLPYPAAVICEKLLAGWDGLKEFWAKTAAAKRESSEWRAWADMYSPFVPAIQPGAVLDWEKDDNLAGVWKRLKRSGPGWTREGFKYVGVPCMMTPEGRDLFPVERSERGLFSTGRLDGFYGLLQDSGEKEWAEHVISPQKFLLPWSEGQDPGASRPVPSPDLPGDWLAGRRLFFGNDAACFTCHQIRGEGIAVGPDLTNLASRDRDSILADILHPSATINPDHPASNVKLRSGLNLAGIVRQANDDKVTVALQAGAVQVLNRADVADIELLRMSFMPEGYADRLTKQQQDDLLKFLMVSTLEPAPLVRDGAPPARKWDSIPEALRTAMSPQAAPAKPDPDVKPAARGPFRILLCAGPKDHGKGEHDYPLWLERWSKLLPLSPGVVIDTSMNFPKREQLAKADVAVFYSKNPGWSGASGLLLDEYAERGGGLVYLHWAVEGGKDVLLLADRIGLATHGGVTTKYRHGPIKLDFLTLEHPITKGFPQSLEFEDETYWNLQGDPSRITPLANAIEDSAPRPEVWVRDHKKGRVFVCIPGHYTWTFDDPLYRLMVLRGICWAAKQDNTDRLSELSTIGARLER